MPTYTVTADIFNVISAKIVAELTDDTAGTTPNTDYIDDALLRAESLVDSYVGRAYDVPLSTPVLPSIRHAVLVLARCSLYQRRHGAIPDEIKESCGQTLSWLSDVAKGTATLDTLTIATNIAEQSADPEVFTKQVF